MVGSFFGPFWSSDLETLDIVLNHHDWAINRALNLLIEVTNSFLDHSILNNIQHFQLLNPPNFFTLNGWRSLPLNGFPNSVSGIY